MDTKALKHMNQVMDWFDFPKVAKTMEALEWIWVDAKDRGDGIPSEPEIREAARKLMQKAYEEEYRDEMYWARYPKTVGTGGLYATYDRQYGDFKLTFEVARWESVGE